MKCVIFVAVIVLYVYEIFFQFNTNVWILSYLYDFFGRLGSRWCEVSCSRDGCGTNALIYDGSIFTGTVELIISYTDETINSRNMCLRVNYFVNVNIITEIRTYLYACILLVMSVDISFLFSYLSILWIYSDPIIATFCMSSSAFRWSLFHFPRLCQLYLNLFVSYAQPS